MYRRMYFVLPDETHALQVMQDIEESGVEHRHIHGVSGRGVTLTHLPEASMRQQHDIAARLEKTAWTANLAVFFIALLALIQALAHGSVLWAAIILVVLAATVFAGVLFALRVPDTHLAEMHGALSHGDVVLMADVPRERVHEIDEVVERRHPEATAGGVGWAIDVPGI